MFGTSYTGVARMTCGRNIQASNRHRFAVGAFAKAFATTGRGFCGKLILDGETR